MLYYRPKTLHNGTGTALITTRKGPIVSVGIWMGGEREKKEGRKEGRKAMSYRSIHKHLPPTNLDGQSRSKITIYDMQKG